MSVTSSVSTGAVTVPSPIDDEAARFSGTPIYLADLERCEPRSSLSPRPQRNHWHAIPYATDRFSGTLIDAAEETYAPPVTYPLNVEGWHAITLGIYQDRYYGDASLQVRLTDDPGYSILTVKEAPGDYIYDVFWKAADLTGQQLTFAQLHGRVFQMWRSDELCTRSRVAYIKLQQADRRRGGARARRSRVARDQAAVRAPRHGLAAAT